MLASAALLAATTAQALPFVQSTVYVQAGKYASDNQVTIGPLGGILTASNSYDDSGSTFYGAWQALANSNAGTVMYGVEPAVGAVSADAQVEVSNYSATAAATGGATLRYYFEIAPLDPELHPDVLSIPMNISAQGSGSISGSGRIIGWATLGVPGFQASGCSFNYEGSDADRSFSACSFGFWAPVTGASYQVVLSGTATAYNFAYPYGSAQSQATVNVDPIIRFDQTAFDALYGSQTFDLATAYKIAYSPVPVPEPGAATLLAIGLLATLLRTRRR